MSKAERAFHARQQTFHRKRQALDVLRTRYETPATPTAPPSNSHRPTKPSKPRKVQSNAQFYQARNETLSSLGFQSYEEYLASRLWQRIRLKVLRRDGFTCRLCPHPASEVHHTLYDLHTMRGFTLGNLYSVCRACHEHVGFSSGVPRLPREMRDLTEELARRKPRSETQSQSTPDPGRDQGATPVRRAFITHAETLSDTDIAQPIPFQSRGHLRTPFNLGTDLSTLSSGCFSDPRGSERPVYTRVVGMGQGFD